MDLTIKNKVLIIGDIMLDQYIYGKVNRISPEAPIPVVRADSISSTLGGAANVANNIASLGAEVDLVGVVGNDVFADTIFDICKEKGIGIAGIVKSNSNNTIIKQRVIGNNQQIVRVDLNDKVILSDDETKMIECFLLENIQEYNLVAISDYNKGVCKKNICRRTIEICKKFNIPVVVDPKGKNWEKYRGCSIITPNLKEISEYCGRILENNDAVIGEKCSGLCADIGTQYLLVTRSEYGMSLVDLNNVVIHLKSEAKEVFDVSGAGDTVVASLCTFLNTKNGIEECLEIANCAAGIAVSKLGTSTITVEEIKKAMYIRKTYSVQEKIMSKDEIIVLVNKWKRNNESIAFTNGCFDVFHVGHVNSIYKAATFAEHLIVAINSDDSVKRLKGPGRPINYEADRAFVVAALGCVDAVVIYGEDTPLTLLENIRPDVLVKGADYKIDEVVGREYANRVELVDFIQGYSTTNTISKMKES